MKKLNLRRLFVSAFVAFTISFTTSCGNDGTDISDKDEKGQFELTIDGQKETGTTVFNGAAVGIRTISAENSNIEIGILIDEDQFKSGAILDIGSMCYIERGTKTALSASGKIKVVSTSKIEFSNAVFTEYDNEGSSKEISVSGYISSK